MRNLHAWLHNVLFGLNVFIVVLLVFESRIVVPPTLQVVGRMHPLLLHFPIVLLVLAWLLATFGKRLAFPWPALHRMVYLLLFASAWSAAISVLAGLLLANEDSYAGNNFLWHKWTGVAVGLLSALLLWMHGQSAARERYRPMYLVGLSCAVATLLIAGHFGASLTHGSGYLLEPLRRDGERSQLDLETAIVYDDLIYPILQAKCLGCHDENKSRGGLVLSDTASILRGGESGPALTRGAESESLVIARLLLDLDHEHRMPPKEKPQLTSEELALVQAWVHAGADFTLPFAALPVGDTIRYLAEAAYGPPAREQYDFPAADVAVVESLNTPYRSLRPLAEGSPALGASFFGKAIYTSEDLQQLSAVATQVVSLNLSGMPLTDTDAEILRTFVNLRELVLNDTPIDDTWGTVLASLPTLRRVSVAGTRFTGAGLSDMLQSTSIRAVYVWNTSIDIAVLEPIQQQHQAVHIEAGYVDDGSVVLPLNRPTIEPANGFFRQQTQISFNHPVSGVELRYTLDGSSPDSSSALYEGPFTVAEATEIKVKAFKSGWLASDEVVRSFYKSECAPQGVSLAFRPHPRYRGREATALFDLVSGGDNHADGKWLGFHGQDMDASIQLGTPTRVDTIGIHVKQDYGAHIYPPQFIEVWAGEDSASVVLHAEVTPTLFEPGRAASRRLIPIGVSGDGIGYIRLVAKPVASIPDGYPGATHPAWIFVDEVAFY